MSPRAGTALGFAAALALGAGCAGAGRNQPPAEAKLLTGIDERSAGPAVAVRWTLDLEPPFSGRYIPLERAAPAVDSVRDRVYVGSSRGSLVALSPQGQELYRYDAGAAIEAKPAVDAVRGEVYVATVRGAVLALDGEDASLRWRAHTGAAVSQPILLHADAAYAVTDQDAVFALSRADGSVLWRYRREPREGFSIAGHAGLALADGTVLAAFDDGVVAALDASDGRVLWELDTAADLEEVDPTRRFPDVDTTPVVVGDTVYVASFSGGLYGLDLETGTVRLHEPELTTITGIAASRDALLISSAERGVTCLDLSGLTPRWQRPTQNGAPSRAEIHGDTVFVAESLGALLALALADGREVGRIQTAHGMTAPPTLEHRRGFALSNAATLYAFTP